MHRILTFVGAAQFVRADVSFDTWSEEEEVTGSKKKLRVKITPSEPNKYGKWFY